MYLKIDVCGVGTGAKRVTHFPSFHFELYKAPRNLWKPHSCEHDEHIWLLLLIYNILYF